MFARRRDGFTLIEMLIVIVIMAVLAATVIPQFAATSEDAKDSTLQYNLHTLRSQIELYKLQHGGTAPALSSGDLPQLYKATDAAGTASADGQPDATHPYGPYILNAVPKNPLNGNTNTVTASATWPPAADTNAGGWFYHEASGRIAPNAAGHLND